MANESKQHPMFLQEWSLEDPSACGPNVFGLTASDFEMSSPEPEGDLEDLMREMKEAPPWSETFTLDLDLPFVSSGLPSTGLQGQGQQGPFPAVAGLSRPLSAVFGGQAGQPSSAPETFVDQLLMPATAPVFQCPSPAVPKQVESQNSKQQAADDLHNNSVGSMRTQPSGAEVAKKNESDGSIRHADQQQLASMQPATNEVSTALAPLCEQQGGLAEAVLPAGAGPPAESCFLQPQFCYPFCRHPTYPHYFVGSYLPNMPSSYPSHGGALQYSYQQQQEVQVQQMLAQQAQTSMPLQAQPVQPPVPPQLQQQLPSPNSSYFPGNAYWRPTSCLPPFPANPNGVASGWPGMPYPPYAGAPGGVFGPQPVFAQQQPGPARPPPAPPPQVNFQDPASRPPASLPLLTSLPTHFSEFYQYHQLQVQAAHPPSMAAGPPCTSEKGSGTPLASGGVKNVKFEPLILPPGTVKSEAPSDLSDVEADAGTRQSSRGSADLPQVVPDASLMAPIHSRMPLSVFSPPMLNQPHALHRQAAVARMVRQACLVRYREKKARRSYGKTIRYQMRKVNAEKRQRVKGRFVKAAIHPHEAHEGADCPHHSPLIPSSPLVTPICGQELQTIQHHQLVATPPASHAGSVV